MSPTQLQVPDAPGVRVTSGVYEGADIPPYYDSLFMLLMTAGADREDAIKVMDRSVSRNLRVEGIKDNYTPASNYNKTPCLYIREFLHPFY